MRSGQYAEALVRYASEKKLIGKHDELLLRNSLCDALRLDEPACREDGICPSSVYDIMAKLCASARERGVIGTTLDAEDGLVARLMWLATPRPSEVSAKFESLFANDPVAATDYLYSLSIDNTYIRMDRIAKNIGWQTTTPYGDLQITINLSKPEKDPKEIAAAKTHVASSYPSCLLCRENEGFAGRGSHPARQNLRMVPVKLAGEEWFLQYSPYVYYNEHCIVRKKEHVPMTLTRRTFERLVDFVVQFPHYFLGSNADLPIVGGSILSHDHFQGGRHVFPMQNARGDRERTNPLRLGVTAQIVDWPMSVVRLRSFDSAALVDTAELVYESWKTYSDPDREIIASTAGTRHNAVTPIARRRGELFEMDVVHRNNRTDDAHPEGIFHPHRHLHHIKKENIGLIEVMGLAILPGRLEKELSVCEQVLAGTLPEDVLVRGEMLKHEAWMTQLLAHGKDGIGDDRVIRTEVARRFQEVLECAGVFKCTADGREGFEEFLSSLQFI